jgi:hypothetical protein
MVEVRRPHGGRMPIRDVSQTSASRGLVVPDCANCLASQPRPRGEVGRCLTRRSLLAVREVRLRLGNTRRRRPAITRPTDPQRIRMTARAPLPTPRFRYDDSDLVERMETAMARTRRLINCSRALRASVESQDGTPFTPRRANCHQSGRTHESLPTSEHHYICAHCHRRWVVDGVLR